MNRSKLQKGSALSIMLILAVGVGSVVTSFLSRTLVEQARVVKRAAVVRASRHAVGQLELAKSLLATSTYTGGLNDVLAQSLAANPPCVPGTGVMVESAGPSRWYRLASFGAAEQQTAGALMYMRDGTPYVAYNYYVEDQSLGISGRPRGKIHTNYALEFYFADGFYNDYVSAGEGFSYKNGATSDNTVLAGGSNPATPAKNLLDYINYTDLKSTATVVLPANLEAVVALQMDKMKIEMWSKPQIIKVPVTKYKKVQIGSNYQQVTKQQYKKEWQWVDVSKTRKVWVPVDTSKSGGGTDLGGGTGAGGYWKTETYVVKEYKLVNVPDGTYKVWEWVPVYENQPYTVYVDQIQPGTLQSSTTYPADGVFYFQDNVKSLSGSLNGKVTLVTDYQVVITNNIQYKDVNGEYAYKYGLDMSQEYVPNPKFLRNHALGVIAKGDIRYGRNVPTQLEINASLISTNGTVGFEDIVVGADGTLSLNGTPLLKESLRRFGSIMSSKRPISTLLDDAGQVKHGFKRGASEYDRNLVLTPPPGYPSEQVVMFEPTLKAPGAAFTAAGDGEYDPTLVTPLGGLMPILEVRELVHSSEFAW